MAIDLTPEQRAAGEQNFGRVTQKLGLTRRDFMKSGLAATGAVAGTAAAVYFGYQGLQGKPIKTALIGGGDEGGVLVGFHNPEYLQFVAVCDIRPSNKRRIFEGDPSPTSPRKGFKKIYGSGCDKKSLGTHYIEQFDDYKKMLADRKDIEAVVIALPLHLHAPVAIECMRAGKHVLCEKLMAWDITQCKQMIAEAKKNKRILSIGHQRHYSLLYAHALEVVKSGVLGDIRHIRALWHRNFTWPFVAPKGAQLVEGEPQPAYRDSWYNPILKEDYDALKDRVGQYGYKDVEQLIRWRLYEKTGGGLMAELGSHQMDACSIFLGKVHPLAVTGIGTKSFYKKGKNDRDIDDHIFVTYEFPGKNYASDKNDVVVVTYSSINTNQFENYGECLTGTRGTMIVEKEQKVMLFPELAPGGKGDPRLMQVTVSQAKDKGAVLDTSGSETTAPAGSGPGGSTPAGPNTGPVSRGYTEEMNDFAYCIRRWEDNVGYARGQDGKYEQRLPRCHGEVAMADAIIALTANRAMKKRQRIEFKQAWFDAETKDVPDPDAKPQVSVE